MTDRQIIIERAQLHAEALIGMDYSRTYRYDWYPEGSADCSSFTASNFLAAGFPLLRNGKEQYTSTYEVYASGFDLIYPASYDLIGKNLPKTTAAKNALKAKVLSLYQEGDIVFDNFDTSTSRANKITHVRMIGRDAKYCIHTANNREKACKVSIEWGATHVCAIIRLKDNVKLPALPVLTTASNNVIYERMLQTLLNVTPLKPQLRCDGNFGGTTLKAVKAFQTSVGLPATGVVDESTWNKLFPIIGESNKEEEDVLKKGDKGINVYLFQRVCRNAGYKMLQDGKQWKDMFEKDASGKPLITGCDGSFGDWTVSVVKQIQTKHGLPVTGIVDYTTYGKVSSEIKTNDAIVADLINKNALLTNENTILKTAVAGAKSALSKV